MVACGLRVKKKGKRSLLEAPFHATPLHYSLLPTMSSQKPPVFYNITPVNPNGMTLVDLGEMVENLEPTRHSSLPPPASPILATREHKSRGVRHGSLPPNTTRIRFPSPAEVLDEISEVESNVSGHGEADPNPTKVS